MQLNQTYPRIHNDHTSTQLIGIAHDPNTNLIYYCSNAGPGVSIKAIFSSLASNKKTGSLSCSTLGIYNATGANPLTSWSAQLPNTHIQHAIISYREDNLLLVADAAAADLTDTDDPSILQQRQDLLTAHMPTIHNQLTLFLNQHTDVPVDNSWAKQLWNHAITNDHACPELAEGAITTLTTYGDCLAAWLINPKFNWLKLTQQLIKEGTLPWPSN